MVGFVESTGVALGLDTVVLGIGVISLQSAGGREMIMTYATN